MPGDDIHGHMPQQFSFWVAVCFTLNYSLGSGFLTLPWAFQQTGPIIGFLVLLLFGFYGFLSVIFLLEAGDRAQSLVKSEHFNSNRSSSKPSYRIVDLSEHNDTTNAIHEIEMKTIDLEDNDTEPTTNISLESEVGESTSSTVVTDRKFEVSELCDLFLGKWGRLYTVFVMLFLYGALWAYCTVFANALAVHLPTKAFGSDNAVDKSYYLYLAIYATFVVPVSLLELSEQISLQVALTVFRIVMLVLMIGSVAVAYFSHTPEFGEISHDYSDRPTSHPEKLYILLPIATYAFSFHHSTPSLAHPVQDKSCLVMMFFYALLFCFIAYTAIGTVVSLYFGDKMVTSSNLSWEHFEGIRGSDGSIPVYAQLLSFFVVLFPALDVASSYPLNAFTLGNNMMSSYYGDSMREQEKNRWKVCFFRAFAALPPVLGASFVKELGSITDYTGLSAFGIMFIFPALLSIFSARRMQTLGLPVQTIHSSYLTGPFFQYLIAGSGILLLIIVSVCLVTIPNE